MQQPPPLPVAPPQPVAPPVNALPKPVVQPRDNSVGFALADPAVIDFVAEQNKQEAIDTINRLGDALAPGVKSNKDVADALEIMRNKIRNDQPVTQADIDRLQTTIEAASGAPLSGPDAARLKEFTDPIRQESLTAAILKASIAGGGGILPPGVVVIDPIPVWPGDVVLLVPGGDAVLVGTGGVPLTGSIASETDALGNPVGAGEPIANTSHTFGDRSQIAVYLTNPEQTGATVSYLLNGYPYTIKPGFTQPLPVGQAWEIRFDRGQGKGEAHYGLQNGTYAFEVSDQGWDLRQIQSVALTIDNSQGSTAFQYTKDDVHAQVGPGETRTETSASPILIRFNRGESGKINSKLFCQSTQTAVVALNPNDGLLDLYPAEPKMATTTPQKVTPAPGGTRTSQLLELLKQKKADLPKPKPKSPLDLLKETQAPDSVKPAKPGTEIESPIFPRRVDELKKKPEDSTP